MKILEERTLSMYEAVVLFLDANAALVAGLHDFSTVYVPFKAKLAAIKLAQQQQRGSGSKDLTRKKADLRRGVTAQTLQLLGALKAVYVIADDHTHDDVVLKASSYWSGLADTNFVSDCRNVLALGTATAAGIANYGIDTAWLTGYEAAITAFDAVLAVPRLTVAMRSAYTTALATDFAEAKVLLHKMTILIETKAVTEPVFYNRYLNSKKIVNLSSRLTAFRMAIKSTDGIAQTGFTVALLRQATGDTAIYKTNKSGTLVRQNMVDGTYEITITKNDYAPLSGKIVLIQGETYVLEVTVDVAGKVFKDGRNPKTGETI